MVTRMVDKLAVAVCGVANIESRKPVRGWRVAILRFCRSREFCV